MKAEFISQNNGEFAFGIPSSEMVWKTYVSKIDELKKAADIASTTK